MPPQRSCCYALLAFGLTLGESTAEPTQEDIEHLMFDLEEAEPEERDVMVRKLARTLTPLAAPALLTVLADLNEEDLPMTRELAERYACRLADERVVPVCMEMLKSENPEVRRYALRVLPFAGNAAAVKCIRQSLEDPELQVRSAAIKAMGDTGDPSHIQFLEGLCKSRDSRVSGAAKFALRNLKWQTGLRKREDFSKRIWPKRMIVQVGRNSFWKLFIGNGRLHCRLVAREFQPESLGDDFVEALKKTRLVFLTKLGGKQQAVVFAGKNAEAIKQFLKDGGTLVFDGDIHSREVRDFLKSIQVPVPLGAKRGEYSAGPSTEEVHSLTSWPLRISDLASVSDGRVCWKFWSNSQCAPYRNQSSPEMAAMVVQENVLGTGRVIFNGITELDIEQRHCDMVENLIATAWDSPDRTLYYFFRLLHDFKTPAWEFARPWAGPKLKVLFIGDQYGKRDIVELCQRTDLLDYEYATIVERREGPYGRNSNTLEGASVVDIQQKLAGNYEVYVIARRGKGITRKHWELLPENIRRFIVRRVRAGAGLLILGSGAGTGKQEKPDNEIAEVRSFPDPEEDSDFALGTLPYETKGEKRRPFEDSFFHVRQAGKGRVLLVNDFPKPASRFASPGLFRPFVRFRPHDYNCSALLRALLWLGRKAPKIQILGLDCMPGPVPVFEEPVVTLRLKSNSERDETIAIAVETINRTGQITAKASGSISLAAGAEKETGITLPPLPAGVHVARISLRRPDGSALNWASVAFQVAGPAKLSKADWDQSVYRKGETIRAAIQVDGEIPEPGAELQVRLVDSRGRLMAEKTQHAAAGSRELAVELEAPEPVAVLADLRLKLAHERGPLAEEQFPVTFTWPRKDLQDFKWYLWRSADRGDERWATVRLGVDYSHAHPETADNSLRFSGKINRLSFDIRGPAGGGGGNARRPCYQNSNYHYQAMKRVEEKAAKFLKTGIRDIMLEDEAAIGSAFCFCPSCRFHFREWARREYKTLDAVNAEWGTKFDDWENVTGRSLNEVKDANHPGAWLDHRRYMDSVFSARIRRYREAIQHHIPDATIGMSGTQRQSPGANYDWWQLCRAGNLWLAYGGAQTKLRRSFKTPDTVMAMWSGGYGRHDSNELITRRRPWKFLFDRYDAYAYYWGSSDAFIMLEGDLTPINKAFWTGDEIARLKKGVGKMLLRSQLETFGIGMHYSMASQYSSYPTAKVQSRRPKFMDNLLSLGMPFEDLRRQFTYVAYQEIELGELVNREFKLLLLPNSQAISRREAEQIRKFVEAGGTAIADFAVGQRNEHGTWLKKGLLEDLFGLRVPKPNSSFKEAALQVTKAFGSIPAGQETAEDGHPTPFGKFATPFDDGIELTTATPHGSLKAGGKTAPALLVNEFGKGKAIYLNFSFNGYGSLRVRGFGGELTEVERLRAKQGERIRQIASALMELAGVSRDFRWERSDGKHDFSDVYFYHNGPLSYVGVTPGTYQEDPVDWNKKDDYLVTVPQKSFVYDSREGKLVAEGDRVNARPATGMTTLYAVLPYQVKSINIGSGTFTARQQVRIPLELITSGGEPGEHVIHVNVFDATEKIRLEYRQNPVTIGGKAEAKFPLALNDPPGVWRVTARDAATGVESEGRFNVK